jgi:hypothetical protein
MVIVGWSLTFLLPLALLVVGTVTQGNDGPWLFSLFFLAPAAALGFLLLAAARREVPQHRFLGLAHLVTLLFAIRVLPAYWRRVTLARDHIAAGFSADFIRAFEPEWWHVLWAPVMTSLLLCAVLFNAYAWMRRPTA